MGTSSSFKGAGGGTSLLPTWADSEATNGEPGTADGPPDDQESLPARPAAPNRLDIVPALQKLRFQQPRLNFTRYVTSGGTDRQALGRALRGHVRSVSGGARTAARRMSSSRRTASNLMGVLRDMRDKGVAQTLEGLNLGHLAGRSLKEILLALTNVVCASGGLIDEAIARNAYVETIAGMVELGESLDTITKEQTEAIILDFIARSIEDRVINDIGQTLDTSAITPEQANEITEGLKDFISGAVRV